MHDNADFLPKLPEGGEGMSNERKGIRTAEKRAKCRFDPTREYEPIQYTFSKNGISFAPLGDIQDLKGAAKQGKTFALTLLMGVALRGEYMGIKSLLPNAKVLYFDTEQHPRNTQEVYWRICHIAGIDGAQYHERLDVLCTRGYYPDEQFEMLEDEIEEYQPNLVFVDGIKDVCRDFNDQEASTKLTTDLMRIAMDRNCAIFNIIHTNPGTDKMRGHLGTELANKASDVFSCTKNKNADGTVAFTMKQTDTRNADIDEITFTIENVMVGNRCLAVPVSVQLSSKEETELCKMFGEILADGCLKCADLKDRVMELHGLKKTAAYDSINKARDKGIIAIDPVFGKYYYVGVVHSGKQG